MWPGPSKACRYLLAWLASSSFFWNTCQVARIILPPTGLAFQQTSSTALAHCAHMVLFPPDDAMVQWVGEARYVRWMDDQNMAVKSRAEGLRVLSEVGRA